jgi:hypothetical protein
MSHTTRRRRTRNAHERGMPRQVLRFNEAREARERRRKPYPEPAADEVARMVTDHAVVRWMTRAVGVDVRGHFIAQLLPPDRAALVASVKNGRVRVNGTALTLVVRGGVVATVVVDGETD